MIYGEKEIKREEETGKEGKQVNLREHGKRKRERGVKKGRVRIQKTKRNR